MRYLCVLLATLLATPSFAAEKVYKSVGPNGEITFSDTPSPGATELNVQPAPTIRTPPVPEFTPGPTVPTRQVAPRYTSLSINSPADQSTVVSTEGKVSISVNVEPPVRVDAGDRLEILLDGKVVSAGANSSISLDNIDRGAHNLSAAVVNRNGDTLLSSQSVTFYLQRPSIHLPGRPKPAPPPAPKQ